LIVSGNLVVSLRKGKKAAANPWGASTLEWSVSSPPPTENFSKIPADFPDPYDYSRFTESGEKRSHKHE
jgi:cytochrome c oxidase subunit I